MGAKARHRVEQSGRAGIVPDDIPVDRRRVEGFGEGFRGGVLHGPEQRPVQGLCRKF